MYNLGIYIYSLLIKLASPFNVKARQWVNGRKGLWKVMEQQLQGGEKRVWFHCSSLGEFEQGRPLMEEFRARHPEYKIVLTFFSPSGYEIRKNYNGADYIFYLPADTKRNAVRFVSLIQPEWAIFIKYEFWLNYLKTLKKQQIRIYLASANFRSNQLFFKWYGSWYRKFLGYFTHIFVQNVQSQDLLRSINMTHVSIAGDTRFDRVAAIAQKSKDLPLVEKFKEGKLTLIAGSSWGKDEEILVKYINEAPEDIKFIIAPHELHEENIKRLINSVRRKSICYSQASGENVAGNGLLIIDNIGMLSSLYKYGNIGYIGGGFGKGIHNILEAATFGLPVLFGPNYHKFQEALDLIKEGGAFPVEDYGQLKNKLDEWVNNRELLNQAGRIAKDFVAGSCGATDKILNLVTS